METYTAESTLHCDSCSISAHEMDKESVGDKESEFLVQIKGPCSSEGTLWAFQASFTKKAGVFLSTSRTYILRSSAIPVHAEKYSQRNIYNVDLILNIWFYILKYL